MTAVRHLSIRGKGGGKSSALDGPGTAKAEAVRTSGVYTAPADRK